MSFVPAPCASEDCCPETITGFCLEDGTPIGIVVLGNTQIGWINFETGIFTPGAVPAGVIQCGGDSRALDCVIDSVTVCPPASGVFEVEIVNENSCSCFSDAGVSRVSSDTSAVTIILANVNRKGLILWNDSTSIAYLKLGAGASTTDFTWKLGVQSGYELPNPIYLGLVTAVWDSATGAMQVTELI